MPAVGGPRGLGSRILPAALLALVLVASLEGYRPPSRAGLTIRALDATTELHPGDTVRIRVAGARVGQAVSYGLCGDRRRCPAGASATAGPDGALTVAVPVAGTGPYLPPGLGAEAARPCRPDGCHLVAFTARDADGLPADVVSVPLTLVGGVVRVTVTPRSGLGEGQPVTVRGLAPGAEGRRVLVTQEGCRPVRGQRRCRTEVLLATVSIRADGRFETTVRARRIMRAGAEPLYDCAEPDGGSGRCRLVVQVQLGDGYPDQSFGMGSVGLNFSAPAQSWEVRPG